MGVPEMTPEQRAAGLEKAKESRTARAEAARKLRDREWSLADVFAVDSDDPVAGMKLAQVLKALPGFGPVRVEQVMSEADVHETRRVRGVGESQRKILLAITSGPRQQ